MTKVALIGASGQVGTRILKELSDRGDSVTAIARSPGKIPALPGVTAVQGDVYDREGLAQILKGHDVVVSAVRFVDSDPQLLLDAVRQAGVPRYIVVGGAGGLEVTPGVKLIDTPDFPEAYKAEAAAGVAFYQALLSVDDLDWTFLAPSALFTPGERTGHFRLGGDQLLSNDKGSSISFEDYAIAMADEIAAPQHIRQRFTVGY